MLTIFTPTILRPTLDRTCRSIERQSYPEWEHIVIVDKPEADIPERLRHPQRKFVQCKQAHGGYGHRCRNAEYPTAKGIYVLNIDDDDYYAPGAFESIAAMLTNKPEWMLFPAWKHNRRWLYIPPGKRRTACCQIAHRCDPMWRFPASDVYDADGDFVEALMRFGPPMVLDAGNPLVIIPESKQGVL